jgi:hypothetical protein
MKKTTIYVPDTLRNVVKSRAAIKGVSSYRYLANLVMTDIEQEQQKMSSLPATSTVVTTQPKEQEQHS